MKDDFSIGNVLFYLGLILMAIMIIVDSVAGHKDLIPMMRMTHSFLINIAFMIAGIGIKIFQGDSKKE